MPGVCAGQNDWKSCTINDFFLVRRLLLCRNQEVRRKTDNGESPSFLHRSVLDLGAEAC
jgi:hypothetical protein